MRRNIVRYAMLSYVITLQKVSFRVKKRFPTWQHMVDAGEYNLVFGISALDANLQAVIQGVPLATETGISLIILTPMKILQRNLNGGHFQHML